MHVLPADAARAAGAGAGELVPRPGGLSQLLCVPLQEMARAWPLLAPHPPALGPWATGHAGPLEHPMHGRMRARDVGLIGQPPRAPAGPLTQLADPLLFLGRHPRRGTVRAAGALGQTRQRRTRLWG